MMQTKNKILVGIFFTFMLLRAPVTVFADYHVTYEPLEQGISSNGGYTIEKFSHPDRGAGETDGILDPGQPYCKDAEDARSQSYAWSMIEKGDYLYVGTCYNSTYGIYYRQLFNMMTAMGKPPQEAAKIAKEFVALMFSEQLPETLTMNAVILRIHKTTGEVTVAYSSLKDDPGNYTSGYRMAFEFKGKLYFISLGNPAINLVEIDPDKAVDAGKIVYKRKNTKNTKVAGGTHGLLVHDDQIILAVASDGGEEADEYNDPKYLRGKIGAEIIASSGPDENGQWQWRIIANQDDMMDLPAVMKNDGLYGGGIWDLIEYDGKLYVTVVTDKTNAEGITNKQGFAMFRGTATGNGQFAWEPIVGPQGAKYPEFGLGTHISMSCNLFVYNNHLYLGTYNDPMCDWAAIADKGNFKPFYDDLRDSIYLYRMDRDENIQMIGGRPNKLFPKGPIGNLGAGLGKEVSAHCNQYVWRFAEHDGELYVGTFDAATLGSAFTQLADGQIANLSKEAFNAKATQLLKLLATISGNKIVSGAIDRIAGNNCFSIFTNNAQKLFQLANGNSGKIDPVPYYEAMYKSYENFKERLASRTAALPARTKRILPIKTINNFIGMLDRVLYENPSSTGGQLQPSKALSGFVHYSGINYYIKKSVKGFDLLVSKDGVHFDVITNNGLNDMSNHGVRTMESTDSGLFIGTANPYHGAQIWLMKGLGD